jgi:hypothetical protein
MGEKWKRAGGRGDLPEGSGNWTAYNYIDLGSWSGLVGKAKASTRHLVSLFTGKILHVDFSSVLATIFVTILESCMSGWLVDTQLFREEIYSQQLAWMLCMQNEARACMGMGWNGICSKTRSGGAAPEKGLPRTDPPMGGTSGS